MLAANKQEAEGEGEGWKWRGDPDIMTAKLAPGVVVFDKAGKGEGGAARNSFMSYIKRGVAV